ncbi:MAG: hypothetical protein GY953_29250, partial [bacterium]|nr:hypothetical protein [bacterium]
MRTLLAVVLSAAALLAAPPRSQQMRVRIPVWTQSPQQLSQEELVATVDGEPARILKLQDPSDDLMLLVVLDLVGGLNEIDLAREALLAMVVELPVNAYVGILRAQDGLQVVLDPTTDRDAA